MSIALPAALALAADPITSLVDTAFVGHLGKFSYMFLFWFSNFTFFFQIFTCNIIMLLNLM